MYTALHISTVECWAEKSSFRCRRIYVLSLVYVCVRTAYDAHKENDFWGGIYLVLWTRYHVPGTKYQVPGVRMIRAGPVNATFKRQIGHAPHQFYEFRLNFLARCSSCTKRHTDRLSFFFLFFSREILRSMTDPKRQKIQKRSKRAKKKKNQRGQAASIFARAARIRG